PSRLDQIRAQLEHSRGVGMAVEREIARATGADFDPLAFEMEALQRAIRDTIEETGAITPEVDQYIADLRRLAQEHQALTETESAVRTGLDALGRGLGPIGRLFASSTTFQAGRGFAGFGFDPSTFMTGALGLGIDLLFSAIGGL